MKEEETQNSHIEKPEQEVQYVPVQYADRSDEEDTIDLIEMVVLLWNSKKTIGIITILFFLLGVFHFNTEPEEYISEAILVKDEQEMTGSQLRLFQQFGALGGQQGSSLGGGISATLPEIIESIDFQMLLLHQEVRFARHDTTMSLYYYFDHYYESPFRGTVYGFIRDYTVLLPVTLYQKIHRFFRQIGSLFRTGDSSSQFTLEHSNVGVETTETRILEVTPHTLNILQLIGSRINTESEGSLIKATFRLPDPVAAAEANAIFIEKIQEYLIEQRIEKAKRNLDFALTLSKEAHERLNQASLDVANYVDANPGNLTALATIELDRLIAERDRLSSVYGSALIKVEDARMRVQEDTPVFILFQKPLLPNSRVALSPLFLLGFIFLGFTLGVFWVFTVKIYQTVKGRILSS
ncbi:MAG: hypothetical protein EA360_11290 [Balneolaceae bacterium]|nr:MAG: hypothetical protein EA360_11290 [Balneolaceae bacterium]